MDPNFISFGITCYLVFVVSTTLHEAAHAYVAMKLGDLTAYYGGQVSLNPMPHMEREPIGMIAVPIACYLWGGTLLGWASVPYDPSWADRYPKRAALMALAGPLANLSLAFISYVIIICGLKFGWFTHPQSISGGFIGITQFITPIAENNAVMLGIATTLSTFFYLNVLLFLFNLIPVPPLDGSSIIKIFMPDQVARRYQQTMSEPMNSLIGLVIALIVFRVYISQHFSWLILKILYPEITYS